MATSSTGRSTPTGRPGAGTIGKGVRIVDRWRRPSEAEEGEHRTAVGGVVSVGFRGALPALQSKQADGDVAETAHNTRTTAGTHLGFVLAIRHITNVMALVLDMPMSTDQGEQPLGRGLLRVEAGDTVGGFLSYFARLDVDGLAMDAKDLDGVGEVEVSLQFRADLDRAGFDATVPLVGLPDPRGKKNPHPGP